MATIVLTGYCFLFYLSSENVKQEKYTNLFLQIPHVKKVTNFYFYEGTTKARVHLDQLKFIDFSQFDSNSFTETDDIRIDSISGLKIVCTTFYSFNLVEYLDWKTEGRIKVTSIGDVVERFDVIYREIDKLPANKKNAMELPFKYGIKTQDLMRKQGYRAHSSVNMV